jgi:16S rRNA (cytosine967-C5)-methyltransferase
VSGIDPRRVALDVLAAVDAGAFADAALAKALAAPAGADMAAPDRHLATLLVYGTLARRLSLDHTIAHLASRRLERIDARTLGLLRLGLFQIAFLDRVPAYAAVDSSVRLAKRIAPRTAGFVNAVLRGAARDGLHPPDGDPLDRLAIEYSHPRWLVELWTSELGRDEATRLMAADNEAMPTVLRALIDRDDALEWLRRRGVDCRPCRHAPRGIIAAEARGQTGIVLPQGEASQLVCLFVGASAGDRVLDACAAPGGKSAYLAELVGSDGRVVAVDSARGAERRIRRTLDLAAVGNVTIVEGAVEDLASASGPEEHGGHFDAVLVDAPCSGLGTLRQHPEIRWRRTPADLSDLARRQSRILAAAAGRVRPGGRLVYSTCTLTQVENDDVVDAFLAANPDFAEDGTEVDACVAPLCDERGRLRTFPHRDDLDGFFAARLRRR